MLAADVTKIREGLKLKRCDFALLLGIAKSTLYRWESSGRKKLGIDPLQARLLEVFDLLMRSRRHRKRFVALVSRLETMIAERGPMFALHKLLELLYL